MSERSYSFLELIKYLIDFFFARRKNQAEKRKENVDKVKSEIEEEYQDIDKKKEKGKKKNLEKRLHNMFD